MSSRRRKSEEEMKTPLLSLIDALGTFSALLNQIFDEIQDRIPVVVGNEARGALFLAFVLLLAYKFPDIFSFFLTNSRALVIIAILVGLAIVDVMVTTLRPRRLRIQRKLQEITAGIVAGDHAPQDAAGYLDETFPGDLIEQLVDKFADLSPVVQESLIRNQPLTSKQLKKLVSLELDARIVRILVEAHPGAFSRSLLDTWMDKFKDDGKLILAMMGHQLLDSSVWQRLIEGRYFSEEVSKNLKVELEYAQRPSRVSGFLKRHSGTTGNLIGGCLCLAFIVLYLIPVLGQVRIQIPGADLLTVMGVVYLVLAVFTMTVLAIWATLVLSISRLLQALGRWIERRAKTKLLARLSIETK